MKAESPEVVPVARQSRLRPMLSVIHPPSPGCGATRKGSRSPALSLSNGLAHARLIPNVWSVTAIPMNSDQLRAMQAPLKAQYQSSPEKALVTLRARGRINEGLSCRVDTGKALVVAGLHPATGGLGDTACSGDMLLEALVACAGVTLNAVATALGIHLRDAVLEAQGDLDFRGTLGVSKEVPVGFQKIRLVVTLDTDAPEDQVANLLRLTERYCVVLQTLQHPPEMTLLRRNPA
jgi:uncharacterized OsmC-like protein